MDIIKLLTSPNVLTKKRKRTSTPVNKMDLSYILNTKSKKSSSYKDKVSTRSTKDKKKQYYLKNKDKILQTKKKYYLENKDKILQNVKQNYLENKDKKKQYYLKNKDKIAQTKKQYYLKNKDKILQKKRQKN